MFVDASAIIAILVREDDADALAMRLSQAPAIYTSPIALYEAALGIARVLNIAVDAARTELDNFIADTNTKLVPISAEIGRAALDAFERYGRGRHPAQLNMGDCFAYACAKSEGIPLLYKGNDFTHTDLA